MVFGHTRRRRHPVSTFGSAKRAAWSWNLRGTSGFNLTFDVPLICGCTRTLAGQPLCPPQPGVGGETSYGRTPVLIHACPKCSLGRSADAHMKMPWANDTSRHTCVLVQSPKTGLRNLRRRFWTRKNNPDQLLRGGTDQTPVRRSPGVRVFCVSGLAGNVCGAS